MFILGGHKAYAAPVECSMGIDSGKSEATTACLNYIMNMLKNTPSGTYPQGNINVRSFPADSPAFVDISSSASPRLYAYLKDNYLFDFVFKFVVIFGIGYLIAMPIFKR
jgi:hypothetical protein